MPALPMFPLGTVVYPRSVLPLHVFEPRYRALAREVVAGDGRFGVVLIERGSEVGGGDQRTDHGTVVELLRADELPDGRWLLLAVGRERLRVERWLPDDPYPRAEVAVLDEPAGSGGGAGPGAVGRLLERVLSLAVAVGDLEAAPRVDLDPDPVAASFEAATLAPLTPLDAQRVLVAGSAAERLALLHELLTDLEAVLRFRLADAEG